MRKSLATLVLVVLTLTGCTSLDSSTNAGSKHHHKSDSSILNPHSDDKPSTMSKAQIADLTFVTLAHQTIPKTKVLDDHSLIGFGKKVCADFDKLGVTNITEMSVYALNFSKGAGFTNEQGGKFVGYAVAAYCPEYQQIMN